MLEVACAADSAYLPHAATMIHSLLQRHGPASIHLLHPEGLDDDVLATMADWVEHHGGTLRVHAIADRVVEHLPALPRLPRVMWYRIFLGELLPQSERVLYLDCDTLVVDSLEPLWATSLDGYLLGAVDNVADADDAPRGYFNSGVLLMDLDRWRNEACAEQIAAFATERGGRLTFPDQDALNTVLGAQRLALHPRWNCQNSLFYLPGARAVFGEDALREAVDSPAILHFEGPELAKPWHYLSKHPYRDTYLAHRAETPWPRVVLEGRTWPNRLLRPLPARAIAPALRARRRLAHAVRARRASSRSHHG